MQLPFPAISGDNINGYALHERTPDPDRMLMCVPATMTQAVLTF